MLPFTPSAAEWSTPRSFPPEPDAVQHLPPLVTAGAVFFKVLQYRVHHIAQAHTLLGLATYFEVVGFQSCTGCPRPLLGAF